MFYETLKAPCREQFELIIPIAESLLTLNLGFIHYHTGSYLSLVQ